MTTLKELKELEAKALPAPYNVANYGGIIIETPQAGLTICRFPSFIRDMDGDNKIHADLFCSTRNALPDLIRVIELAGDALRYADAFIPNDKRIKQALSEIKKWKGE